MWDDFVFQLGKRSEKFTGFEGFHNEAVSTDAAGFVCFKGLKLTDGEQHWDACGLRSFAKTLAHFQPAVAWHVHVEHDEVRFRLGNFLERRRTVIHRSDVVARVTKDSPPHVLGCHTVIGEQYFPRQAISFM